ncbi:sigma-54-dependent Fis family transcriptional regulator [candidate division KSB1 bacterium]|nr:sigma-54-dependent Fis family transcriptional regulator [candidate division KSB1 bacterium]
MANNKIQQAKVLIVDDEKTIRESLKEILVYHKFDCLEARDGKEALEVLEKNSIDLVLLDIRLPRIDGMEVLKRSLSKQPDLPIIIITGQGTIKLAVEAIKSGAYDFLEKPLEAERTLITIQNALEKRTLKIQRDHLLTETKNRYRMLGKSTAIKKIFSLIDRAAKVSSKVLITGEPGTGKELVARAIHLNSDQAANPFVPVNCSAIPETLIESELFGFIKGAFTDARYDRLGKFQQAHTGTLFLDEIADMSLMMQAKVLRLIEDSFVMPVGSNEPIKVDVRVITATNKNLATEIDLGNFRNDLFYRLNVIPIYLPPLRERKDDLSILAEFFLEEICETEGLPRKTFSPQAFPGLINYQWDGNVRELRNIVERIAVLSTDSKIEPSLISQALNTKQPVPLKSQTNLSLRTAREQFEKEYILKILSDTEGKIQKAADVLGIQRSHLWKKMKRFGIDKNP